MRMENAVQFDVVMHFISNTFIRSFWFPFFSVGASVRYRVDANTSVECESDTNTFRTHASNQKYRRRKQNQSRLHTFRVEI